MAEDSNSRSTCLDNKPKGKKLEELEANYNIHFINQGNGRKSFQNSRGKSEIN